MEIHLQVAPQEPKANEARENKKQKNLRSAPGENTDILII